MAARRTWKEMKNEKREILFEVFEFNEKFYKSIWVIFYTIHLHTFHLSSIPEPYLEVRIWCGSTWLQWNLHILNAEFRAAFADLACEWLAFISRFLGSQLLLAVSHVALVSYCLLSVFLVLSSTLIGFLLVLFWSVSSLVKSVLTCCLLLQFINTYPYTALRDL